MNKPTERRRFWRADFHAPAHVDVAGHEHVVRILDVSLKGALVEHASDWTPKAGQACSLQIKLALEVVIVMECKITHVEASHIGLQCERIDLDGITHLRQLVERNAADPAVLDRDLAMLVGQR